ncbi:MAG: tetratricopeptide repeat protein, partial [Lewinella sp.]|nr:tetratricopeptide repeat protein [Lewinella sp.]
MSFRSTNQLLLFTLFLVVLSACTTQRRRGELSTLGKAWHNTTAHYNGWFNANEIVNESTMLLNEQHEDNYNQLLPMYEYSEVKNPQIVAEQLDEAVRKVTVVMNLHPYSQWADDCYLLAGKAFFLKQDYEGAEKTFRYLINEYPPEEREESSNDRSNNRRNNDDRTAQADEEEERPRTPSQVQRDRKRYNREVRRRRRQRERGKETEPSSRREEPVVEAPAETEPEAEPTPSAPTRVSLSDNTEIAMAEAGDDSYFLKHRPSYQEGLLWLGRALIERDNYEGARRTLMQLLNNPGVFEDVQREAVAALAHLNIQQEDYASAANYLEQAITLANDRGTKARFSYVQAQLYQQLGNSEAAYAAFEDVIRYHPDYTMEFGARLNMAQNSYLAGIGSAEEALANLEKMLKDEKNDPYHDQIYYAMANIALKQGDKEAGIAYLQQSLETSVSNAAQQAETYYLLGTLSFESEDYLAAKEYFDQTLSRMDTNDERYRPTERLRDNLVDIAEQLQTITLQDSLLRIAAMSPEDQAALAQRLKDEEVAAAQAALQPNPAMPVHSMQRGGAQPAIRQESNFFAYDDRAVRRGQRAFDSRWGDRPLQDNWRRSNATGNDLFAENGVEAPVVTLLTPEQIEQVLSAVPKDEAGKQSAELLIKKAMYELGRLYYERLENYNKSIEVLEDLNERFPGNIHELDSWYYLYLAHTAAGNNSEANRYRDLILDKYATSNYGQILQNPNYAQEYLDEEGRLNRQYDLAYQLFEDGQYGAALQQAQQNVSGLRGQHPLKPKYALLMAMCTGNTEGKEAYISQLQQVVATYPNTPEQTRAKEIIRLLGGASAALPGQAEEEATGAFTTDPNGLHYVIIVFNDPDIDLNAAKITVSDYNQTYHSLDRLRISNVYLGESNNIPV